MSLQPEPRVPTVVPQYRYPNTDRINLVKEVVWKRIKGRPSQSSIRKMESFRVVFNSTDGFLDLCEKAVSQFGSSFPIIIIECGTQIPVEKPMIGYAWHLTPEFRFDLSPISAR